jgi:hypothetical protein
MDEEILSKPLELKHIDFIPDLIPINYNQSTLDKIKYIKEWCTLKDITYQVIEFPTSINLIYKLIRKNILYTPNNGIECWYIGVYMKRRKLPYIHYFELGVTWNNLICMYSYTKYVFDYTLKEGFDSTLLIKLEKYFMNMFNIYSTHLILNHLYGIFRYKFYNINVEIAHKYFKYCVKNKMTKSIDMYVNTCKDLFIRHYEIFNECIEDIIDESETVYFIHLNTSERYFTSHETAYLLCKKIETYFSEIKKYLPNLPSDVESRYIHVIHWVHQKYNKVCLKIS